MANLDLNDKCGICGRGILEHLKSDHSFVAESSVGSPVTNTLARLNDLDSRGQIHRMTVVLQLKDGSVGIQYACTPLEAIGLMSMGLEGIKNGFGTK